MPSQTGPGPGLKGPDLFWGSTLQPFCLLIFFFRLRLWAGWMCNQPWALEDENPCFFVFAYFWIVFWRVFGGEPKDSEAYGRLPFRSKMLFWKGFGEQHLRGTAEMRGGAPQMSKLWGDHLASNRWNLSRPTYVHLLWPFSLGKWKPIGSEAPVFFPQEKITWGIWGALRGQHYAHLEA